MCINVILFIFQFQVLLLPALSDQTTVNTDYIKHILQKYYIMLRKIEA